MRTKLKSNKIKVEQQSKTLSLLRKQLSLTVYSTNKLQKSWIPNVCWKNIQQCLEF